MERLLLDRDLSFNNLTLVSPDGFGFPQVLGVALKTAYSLEFRPFCPMYLTSSPQDTGSEYTPSLLAKLGIPTRVRLVDKWMVGLDRGSRVIFLDDDTQVPYESLVIAAGLQDQCGEKFSKSHFHWHFGHFRH